ncbi:MAG: glycosyltransferase family 9 protein [Cyanobacteria bacterium P01_A01_bin.123]
MRVLALVPGGIGDQILFFPTFDDLQQAYPSAEIDVVVEPLAKSAYRISKVVNEVILFDFQANSSPADWANLLGIIRDREYEVLITLSPKWSIGLLLWLSGVPTRIGYADNPGALFLTHTVPRKSSQYQAYVYHDLLQGLGLTVPCSNTAINVPQGDLNWANQQRESLGVKDTGYVLLHDGLAIEAAYPAGQWQIILQNFQARQPNLPLIWLQAPGDAQLIQTLKAQVPAIKVSTPNNVGQMAAMVAGADLVLCTDSVVMQIAVALKVFTLALFETQTAAATGLPSASEGAPETRFIGIPSLTGKLADISAETVLKKVWGG